VKAVIKWALEHTANWRLFVRMYSVCMVGGGGIAFFVLLLSLHIIRRWENGRMCFVVFCYKTIISTWKISRDHMKGSARKSMGLATG